jgi:hypothetical protein
MYHLATLTEMFDHSEMDDYELVASFRFEKYVSRRKEDLANKKVRTAKRGEKTVESNLMVLANSAIQSNKLISLNPFRN